MSKTSAFPKILHIGENQILDIFEGDVEITEKIDGSQFGFGMVDGNLVCRSKGREIDIDNCDNMFVDGVEYVKSIKNKLPDNIFFYGEYLQKPRHSTLAYDRIPKNHIALFGVYNESTREYYNYNEISRWADKLDVDKVKLIKIGKSNPDEIIDIPKNRVSQLGGQNVEGVVVKAYKPWMFLGRIPYTVMCGKYVCEEFKEVHQKDWSKLNTSGGKLGVLKEQYKTEARWNKAIQHLRDNGEITDTVKDIGSLIKEVFRDLEEEEKENIKDQLWSIFGKDILANATYGLPQWYKEKLVRGNDSVEVQSNQEPETLDKKVSE